METKNGGKVPKQTNPNIGMLYYMLGIMLVTLILNALVFPSMVKNKVVEVGYNEFLSMGDSGRVEMVEKGTDALMFIATDAQGKQQVYKTGLWDDPNITERLYRANVTFGQVIPEQQSYLMQILTNWVLPIGIMVLVGQLMSRMLTKKMGNNAMTFGKSNA